MHVRGRLQLSELETKGGLEDTKKARLDTGKKITTFFKFLTRDSNTSPTREITRFLGRAHMELPLQPKSESAERNNLLTRLGGGRNAIEENR